MSNTWTWIGGGNNEWNNPADWQPNGVPMPGDTLVMNGGTLNLEHSIANLQLGNQQNTGGGDTNTVNLTGDILNTQLYGGNYDIINLNSGNILSLNADVARFLGSYSQR